MQRVNAIVLVVVGVAIGALLQRAYDVRRLPSPAAAPTSARNAPGPVLPPWTIDPVERSHIDYSRQPLWAWGVTDVPSPDDKQAVQGGPTAPYANANQNLSPEEVNRKRQIAGSTRQLSLGEIRARPAGTFVDWFPDDHPNPTPAIIESGPAALGKDTRPCGSCHLSDGSGRPENASPAGLPAAYIARQLNDFRAGMRHNADPRKANSNTMVMLAKAMTDEEIKQAADYFSAVTWRPHVRVVEAKLVPKTRIQGELFIPLGTPETEPIGDRIIEVPTDVEGNQTLRNSRGTWIAYVPPGSIEKGKDLVVNGGMTIVNGEIVQGKTTACGTCHGLDLAGVPPDVPPLAGRSPSYLAREIYDIQQGVRTGSNSNVKLMRMVVEKLTANDILNITAYLASRPVPDAHGASKDLVVQR